MLVRDDAAPTTSGPDTSVAPAARPFVAIGVAAVVAGGIVAAVSRPVGWDHGSWVAAYLVLVVGVGQAALGIGQATIAGTHVTVRRLVDELLLLNGGSALVLIGTLTSAPPMVSAGGLVLVVALVLFALTARRGDGGCAWLRRAYATVLGLLLVSTPVGLALSWIRT